MEVTEGGLIEVKEGNNSGKVLAITESEVDLQDKAEDKSISSQIWIKGPANSDGYFTLKNKGTGKFLQGDPTPMTSVKGT